MSVLKNREYDSSGNPGLVGSFGRFILGARARPRSWSWARSPRAAFRSRTAAASCGFRF